LNYSEKDGIVVGNAYTVLPDDILLCTEETPTGSHVSRRVCRFEQESLIGPIGRVALRQRCNGAEKIHKTRPIKVGLASLTNQSPRDVLRNLPSYVHGSFTGA